MDIKEIQRKVIEVGKKRQEIKNYKITEELCLIHLMEEVGELAGQLYNKKARREKFNKENLKEEVCDVILESMILADLLNINLSEELNKKINELNQRLEK